jgi:hypothetical protein
MQKSHIIFLIEKVFEKTVKMRGKEQFNKDAEEFFTDIDIEELQHYLALENIQAGIAFNLFVSDEKEMFVTLCPPVKLSKEQQANVEQESKALTEFFAQFTSKESQ